MVFEKLKQGKQLMQMRSQAQAMQKKMAEITETVEMGNLKVKVSADQKIQYIEIDGEENALIAKALNEAFKKVQKKAAQQMLQDGGLEGLLGGLK